MSELPEVETIGRDVHERVAGDSITEAWFGGHREPFKTSPARQAKGLEGRVIQTVHRVGNICAGESLFRPESARAELDRLYPVILGRIDN
jgi:formamidopyrimidine-DNA glycosylase